MVRVLMDISITPHNSSVASPLLSLSLLSSSRPLIIFLSLCVCPEMGLRFASSAAMPQFLALPLLTAGAFLQVSVAPSCPSASRACKIAYAKVQYQLTI